MMTARVITTTIYGWISLGSRSIVVMTLAVIMGGDGGADSLFIMGIDRYDRIGTGCDAATTD